jgi:hypothetical protein
MCRFIAPYLRGWLFPSGAAYDRRTAASGHSTARVTKAGPPRLHCGGTVAPHTLVVLAAPIVPAPGDSSSSARRCSGAPFSVPRRRQLRHDKQIESVRRLLCVAACPAFDRADSAGFAF